MNKLYNFYYYIFIYPVYRVLFKKLGKISRLKKLLRIDGYQHIDILDNVLIRPYTWIGAIKTTEQKPNLIIKSNAVIGHFNHIIATNRRTIEESVLTADKVYISDNLHTFQATDIPILKQPIKQLKEVVIGAGAWIGENVCIIGVSIGKNSVIGANSVVTKDIPDYSVVVGSPAYIIKRYNFDTNLWQKKDKEGNFI